MTSWTPHDLPHMIAGLARTNHSMIDMLESGQITAPADDHILHLRASTMALEGSPMAWLDADVCGLVEGTHDTVPEWSASAVMPGESGIVALESPFLRAMESALPGAVEVTVDAVAWQQVGDQVLLMALSRRVGGRVFSLLDTYNRAPIFDLFSLRIPLDQAQGEGKDVDTGESDGGFIGQDVATRFTSMVGAMWLIMSQPTLVEDGDDVEAMVRPARKTSPSAPRRMPVRVSTRRLSAQVAGSRGGGGRRGEASSRWWVRGHWRQQAWGKGRALRKPIFIAPHTAGARDAEVDDRPRVQVWRE